MDNRHFQLMSLSFRARDFLKPPQNTLREVGIKPGFHVLDYGCGPGSYSIAAAEMVGKSGKVYALDIHPLAIKSVRKIATKRKLPNIETILSDCATGLPDESIDAVLLYDTFHDLSNADEVLKELHRVLTPDSILSFTDHHMTEDEIISGVTGKGLFKFKLSSKGKISYSFRKK
ncbi:class I SAM-dependent methyltransferase [Chloroflexota bacterium]